MYYNKLYSMQLFVAERKESLCEVVRQNKQTHSQNHANIIRHMLINANKQKGNKRAG